MNSLFFVCSVISSLSNDDDDYDFENVAKKMNLLRLKLLLHLFGPALFFKCGRFFLELNHKDLIQVQK